MHDLVALLEDVAARHFTTGSPLMLRRGQIGTVVMTYDSSALIPKAELSPSCRFRRAS